MTQFEIFASIDWSTKTHQVAVVNAGGVVLGERSFAPDHETGSGEIFGNAALSRFLTGRIEFAELLAHY